MSDFIVKPQELEAAAAQLKQQCEQYLTAATELKQASDSLTGGEWQGDASVAYEDCMAELYAWMDEMSTVIDGFGEVLRQAGDTYSTTDTQVAGLFQ